MRVVYAGLFQHALSWRHLQVEGDEVECIVANLIARGYVKGYISHKMQVNWLGLPSRFGDTTFVQNLCPAVLQSVLLFPAGAYNASCVYLGPSCLQVLVLSKVAPFPLLQQLQQT